MIRDWAGGNTYAMFGTANMTGNEYAVITNGTNTYVGSGSGGQTVIRGPSNDSNPEIRVTSAEIILDGASVVVPQYIVHEGDGNTYMEFNAADVWRVVTGGSQRLLVNNNGVQVNNGRMLISTNDKSGGALDLDVNVTNTNHDFYFAQEINMTLSGSQAATNDREQGGIYMDINATNTGGNTSNEHRAYGIFIDLDATGDSDGVFGVYASATGTPTTGRRRILLAVTFSRRTTAEQKLSQMCRAFRVTLIQITTSDTNSLSAGVFKSVVTNDSGAVTSALRVFTQRSRLTGRRMFCRRRACLRRNTTITGQSRKTNTTALFYGNYAGTLPNTAMLKLSTLSTTISAGA